MRAVMGRAFRARRGHLGVLAAIALAACGPPPPTNEKPPSAVPRDGQLPPGARLAPPDGHLATVHCLAYSPDGRRLVSGSEDTSLLVWDVASGRVVQRLDGHQAAVGACAFLPDGQRVVSGGSKGEAFVWDVSTGDKRALYGLSPRASVYSLGVRPDGLEVIMGASRGEIVRWEIESGHAEKITWPKPSTILAAGYLDDGTPFAGADEGPVVAWAKPEQSIPYHVGSGVSLPGRRMALGGDGEVALVDADGKRTRIGAQEGSVYGLAVSARRDWILAGDDRGNARAWEITKGAQTLRCELPKASRVWAAAIDPTGATMAVAGEDREIIIADVKDCNGGKRLDKVRRLATARSRVASLAAGRDVLVGDSNGSVSAWSTKDWRMLGLYPLHSGEVTALAALPDGGFVSGGSDRTLIAREAPPSPKKREIGQLKNVPSAIAVLPDGASIITSDLYGDINLFSLNGKPRVPLLSGEGNATAAYALALRPGAQEGSVGGELADILKFAFPTANEPVRWPRAGAATETVTALAYTPDGHSLVEGSVDGTVVLRDAASGAISRRFIGLRHNVSAIVLTDQHLWAGGSDRTLIRWSLVGDPASSLVRIDEGAIIQSMAATSDGQFLVAGLADGRAAVHALPTGALVAHLFPMRDGSFATIFPDGRFHTSGAGAALGLAFEDPATRKVATLGGLLHLSVQSPSVTRAEKTAIIKATILSPRGEPTVLLDRRWPIQSIIPSTTVMSAYDLEVRLDDPSAAPHSIDAEGPDGEIARAEVKPEPYLRGGSLHPRALVIGNGAYPGGDIPRLVGALADADSMGVALRSPLSWALDDSHLTVLKDLNGKALKKAVDDFFASAAPGETLLFYYAGHGIEYKGEGYLLPVDFNADRIDDALSATALWKAVEGSKAARAVVLLDACRSGTFAFPTDIGGRLFNQSARHALVTATSASGLAGETARGGRFTQALIEAFNKREAVDQEREAVTLGKAFLYAYGKAYPQQLRLFGGLDTLPLAWPRENNREATAMLDLDRDDGSTATTGFGARGQLEDARIPAPRAPTPNMAPGAPKLPPEAAKYEAIPSGKGEVVGSTYNAEITFPVAAEWVSVGVYPAAGSRRYARPEVQAGPFKQGEKTTIALPLKRLAPGDYRVIVKPCKPSEKKCSDTPLVQLPTFRVLAP